MSHSKLSPSSSKRWLTCNPSIEFNDRKATRYSAEGSAAHTLASNCMLLGVDPATELGEVYEEDGFSFTVNQEMVDCVRMYLEVVSEYSRLFGLEPINEQTIKHKSIADFGGTIDCCFPQRGRPVIIDFKYGAGVYVDVDENTQLGCYAILVHDKYIDGPFRDTEVVIVQPRCLSKGGEVIRKTILTSEFLTDLEAKIVEFSLGLISDKLVSGSHCQFCPGAARCPELTQLALKTAVDEFSLVENDPFHLDQVKEIMDKAGVIRKFVGAVEAWAHNYMASGGEIEGYKLVEKIGNRSYFVNEENVVAACRKKGYGKKMLVKHVLLSPAQLEKVVGKELVNSFCERPNRGVVVVPITDKRIPAIKKTAVEEFEHIEWETDYE